MIHVCHEGCDHTGITCQFCGAEVGRAGACRSCGWNGLEFRAPVAVTVAQAPAVWYLAAPYSHADEDVCRARSLDACFAAGWLMKRGELVLAPTVMGHQISEHTILPKHWEFWQQPSFALLDRCDGLTVLAIPGWRESEGVTAEIARARHRAKPIRLMRPLAAGGYDLAWLKGDC